jgi:hypothetical protein
MDQGKNYHIQGENHDHLIGRQRPQGEKFGSRDKGPRENFTSTCSDAGCYSRDGWYNGNHKVIIDIRTLSAGSYEDLTGLYSESALHPTLHTFFSMEKPVTVSCCKSIELFSIAHIREITSSRHPRISHAIFKRSASCGAAKSTVASVHHGGA